MIVDSSAIMAILFDEPEGPAFSEIIIASGCVMSVVGVLECSMVALSRKGETGQQAFLDLIRDFRIQPVEVTPEQGQIAIEAFRRYGRGRHPARLTKGDCFAYALARSRGQALLFKGGDFSRTDVMVAA